MPALSTNVTSVCLTVPVANQASGCLTVQQVGQGRRNLLVAEQIAEVW